MVRWGIVGLGRMADTEIAPAINARQHGVLQAVISRDPRRAESFAQRRHAVHGLTSYGGMLADPEVDAVYIATPNALHADPVVEAAQAGKHFMCDKPLATSTAEDRRAVAACEAAGGRLGVTFPTRVHAALIPCREAL